MRLMLNVYVINRTAIMKIPMSKKRLTKTSSKTYEKFKSRVGSRCVFAKPCFIPLRFVLELVNLCCCRIKIYSIIGASRGVRNPF